MIRLPSKTKGRECEGLQLFWIVLVLTFTLGAVFPLPVRAVTTEYGGETVEWEITRDGVPLEVSFQYCEDIHPPNGLNFWAKCHYNAKWPPVGSEVRAKAAITPAYVEDDEPFCADAAVLDVCFPNYYADCGRAENCSPLATEDTVLFYPKDFGKDYVQMIYWRKLIHYPSGGHERLLYIYVWLFNTEFFSIESMPWLKGGPDDNRNTRYRPKRGGGPGK